MVAPIKRVFAILHEPASYTIDRNRAVYDKLGIRYCYMNSSSQAGTETASGYEVLNSLSISALIKHLRKILRDNEIIIMNGYTGRTFRLLFLLNFIYRRVIGIDSDTQLNIPSSRIKRLIKWAYLNTVFRNRRIFGLAGGTKDHKELFRHYGMAEERICLMPMVVNNNVFKCAPKTAGKPFRFLFVGRVIPVKNIEIMLKAFVSAFSDSPDVELRIVGKGELLEHLNNEYSHHPNISFAGAKYGKDLVKEYSDASAFILPSSYEPWGLVVNEAMSAALPIIVSDKVGAYHDLVEGKDTGFVFHYEDAEDLANKMRTLANDKALYAKYSQSAFDLMHSLWNYDFYTRCLKDFINIANRIK